MHTLFLTATLIALSTANVIAKPAAINNNRIRTDITLEIREDTPPQIEYVHLKGLGGWGYETASDGGPASGGKPALGSGSVSGGGSISESESVSSKDLASGASSICVSGGGSASSASGIGYKKKVETLQNERENSEDRLELKRLRRNVKMLTSMIGKH